MASFNYQDRNIAIGEFKELEHGQYFEYRISQGNAPLQGDYGLRHGLPHEIAMCDGSVRFANVKKTVAYICVDENEQGLPVIVKWNIKSLWIKQND